MSGWDDDARDWLHGDDLHDTQELPDAYEYEPVQKWEIDAAIASLKAKAMLSEANNV